MKNIIPKKNLSVKTQFKVIICDMASLAIAIILTALFAPPAAAISVGCVCGALIILSIIYLVRLKKHAPKPKTKEEMDAEAKMIAEALLKQFKAQEESEKTKTQAPKTETENDKNKK